jgi:hypothetical protein
MKHKIIHVLKKIFKVKHMAKCGHLTKLKDHIHAFGESVELEITNSNDIGYCHKCLEKMTILCAWCKKPIFIGNVITLYSSTNKDFKIPKHAVVHNKKHNSLVGCGRTTCADTGMDYVGTWMPPGKVQKRYSVYDALFDNPDAKAVIRNNPDGPLEIIK